MITTSKFNLPHSKQSQSEKVAFIAGFLS